MEIHPWWCDRMSKCTCTQWINIGGSRGSTRDACPLGSNLHEGFGKKNCKIIPLWKLVPSQENPGSATDQYLKAIKTVLLKHAFKINYIPNYLLIKGLIFHAPSAHFPHTFHAPYAYLTRTLHAPYVHLMCT